MVVVTIIIIVLNWFMIDIMLSLATSMENNAVVTAHILVFWLSFTSKPPWTRSGKTAILLYIHLLLIWIKVTFSKRSGHSISLPTFTVD